MIARTLPGHRDRASLGVYGTGRVALAPPVEEATPRNIEELCEQFIAVCESAVDPLEISSALEFEGLNDQAVRKRYGVSDVFALAEEMYRRVPAAARRARADPGSVAQTAEPGLRCTACSTDCPPSAFPLRPGC